MNVCVKTTGIIEGVEASDNPQPFFFAKVRLTVRENEYQHVFIQRLRSIFPGCLILKNDSGYIQGIPDLLFLYEEFWAAFEVKQSLGSFRHPNQEYYVEMMHDMSFAAFVCPENEAEVIHALQSTLSARRPARISKR